MKLLTIIFILLFAISAQAATYTVTRTDDRNATCHSGSDCSLREAVNLANASGTDNTINFALIYPSTISLTQGELAVNSNITFAGPGARNLTIQRSTTAGTANFRIFFIGKLTNIPNITATFIGMTISNGYVTGTTRFDTGGAINNSIGLTGRKLITTLNEVVIKNNYANAGGGVFNNGEMYIINSLISDNKSKSNGAGINNNGGSGKLAITNSTICNNREADVGGAIYSAGELNLTNSTVANNSALATGGIQVSTDYTTYLRNTIVASNKNTSSQAQAIDISPNGKYNSLGNNLIGINTLAEAHFPAGDPNINGDKVGTANNPFNPLLGELQNNGGQTDTLALLLGSPAINAGNNMDASTTDQRGFARIVGGTIDIGAYEFVPAKSRKRIRFF